MISNDKFIVHTNWDSRVFKGIQISVIDGQYNTTLISDIISKDKLKILEAVVLRTVTELSGE